MFPGQDCVWQAADPASLHVRQWGDEWAVFHETTGQTHLLNPLAVALYRQLQEGGGPEEKVVNGALRALGCDGDRDLASLARQTLHHLEHIGLARIQPP